MDNRKYMGKDKEGVIFPVAPNLSEMSESYLDFIDKIKKEIQNQRLSVVLSANSSMICLYWNIGRDILQKHQEECWGAKVVDRIAKDLKDAFPDMSGFSPRNIKYMRKFAECWPDFEFVQQVVAQIPWGHNIILLDKIKNFEERSWYIKQTIENGWSRNILTMQIEIKLYERKAIAEKVTNFTNTLPDIQSDLAEQTLKDPYLFDFISLKGKTKELELEREMISKIKNVLIELGKGFAFVGSEYKVTVSEKDYFIDLLFYHLKLKCYVVVELKAREFEPTDAGQLNFYLSAIDDLVKEETDNATIGILLCKSKDNFTAEYALRNLNSPIGVSEYKFMEDIPEYLQAQLPRAEDIEIHINDVTEE